MGCYAEADLEIVVHRAAPEIEVSLAVCADLGGGPQDVVVDGMCLAGAGMESVFEDEQALDQLVSIFIDDGSERIVLVAVASFSETFSRCMRIELTGTQLERELTPIVDDSNFQWTGAEPVAECMTMPDP